MSDNPYLPPTSETDVPDAPQSHGWFVRDQYLYVEPNALLPMVELLNGKSEDRMILRTIRITKNPTMLVRMMVIFPSMLAFGILLAFLEQFHVATLLCFIGACGGIAVATIGLFRKSTSIQAFFTHKSSQELTSRSLFGSILGFILGGILFTQLAASSRIPDDIQKVLGIVFLTLLVVRIAVSITTKNLTCRRSMGSHLEIRGVHPVALERLRGLRQG